MLDLRSDTGNVMDAADRVLASSHQRVTRVSVLDDTYNPLPGGVLTGEDGYMLSGSVSMSRTDPVARTLGLELVNPDGIWTPTGQGSLLYWDRLLRVERGVRVAGQDFLAPAGVFQIDSPEVQRSSGVVLKLTGADRMDRATRSQFTDPETHAVGSGVGAVIRAVLEAAGVGTDRWTVDDGGATLGAARSYEVGEERLSAAMRLANDFALEVFADARGYMVVRPKPDPLGLATAWTFEAGVSAVHEGVSVKWSRDKFYNHILVTGESADQDPIRAEAADTNPASPTRTTGPMGDRLLKYTSAMITTVPQAQAVAYSLLWERAMIEEQVTIPHVPLPLLEAGDAIVIREPTTGTNDRYVVDNLSLPLAGGAASLNVKKARSLA